MRLRAKLSSSGVLTIHEVSTRRGHKQPKLVKKVKVPVGTIEAGQAPFAKMIEDEIKSYRNEK